MNYKHQERPAQRLLYEGEAALKARDFSRAERLLDKALQLAIDSNGVNDIYFAYVHYVELHWLQGYESAKLIRENGLYNRHLNRVIDYALAVVDMLKDSMPFFKFSQCKPLDRLFMLYAFTGKFDEIAVLIGELETLNYGHLMEVACWKVQLPIEIAKAEKRLHKKNMQK